MVKRNQIIIYSTLVISEVFTRAEYHRTSLFKIYMYIEVMFKEQYATLVNQYPSNHAVS